MKKKVAAIITGLTLMAGGTVAFAEMDHSMHQHEGHQMKESEHMEMSQEKMGMNMPEGMSMKTMEIDGYKLTFHIMNRHAFRNYMDKMGHKTHKMKPENSHYVMTDIHGPGGKKISRAAVKMKLIAPDNKAQEKALFGMMGSFGNDFSMKDSGKYQIMTLFKVKGQKHKGGFWHEMK